MGVEDQAARREPKPARDGVWSRRLRGVDAARGVALIGMMAIHVLPALTPAGDRSVAFLLAHGRSAAAFAVLAGVGLALATSSVVEGGRGQWAATARAVTVRALAIGAVGLALGYPDSGVAVILPYYALFFLLAIPLLRLGAGALAGLALGSALVVPVLSHALRTALPSATGDNPTLATLASQPVRLLSELTLTGYYPALSWMAYLCAGLAVGRLRLRSPRVAVGLLSGGVAVASLASAVSWILLRVLDGRAVLAGRMGLAPGSPELDQALAQSQYGVTPTTSWWWLAVNAPHSSTPIDLLHTIGTALAVLGAALLLAHVAGWVLVPLAAAGGMTLSLYTTHVVLLATPWLPADPYVSYGVQLLLALVAGTVLWSMGRRGPLEWIVATLARQARQARQDGHRR